MTKTLQQCALTPAQEKAWDETRTALLWHCPAFSHLFYTMLDNCGSKHVAYFTEDVPIAATDGSNLLLNPHTFFEYNLSERIFICAHEIMHCVWDHCGLMHNFRQRGKITYPDGEELPYNQQLMNVATDLVINDLLIESNVGQYNSNWLHDRDIATSQDSAIEAYRKLFEDAPKGGGSGQGQGQGKDRGQGFDEHLDPGTSQGKDPQQAKSDRNESAWNAAINAAHNAAKAQGKMPAGLDRVFGEILDPQVDWREHIQALFARKLGGGSYNWRRPDRRLIVRDMYAPGRSGFGAGTVVVGADTSGSIGAKELDLFMAEVSGILEEIKPERLFLIWCDAAIGRVDEVDDVMDLNEIRGKGATGGGGTSFVPVFEWVAEQGLEPDALVYLTDGYGPFPDKAPGYPVIWGTTACPPEHYPFGDVVEVPVTKA